jgi:ClpP class serine protease
VAKLDLATGKILHTKDYVRIATKIRQSVWLITPEGLNAVLDIANSRLSGEQFDQEYLEELAASSRSSQDGENNYQIVNGVGILPIMGPIFGKANLMTQFSGATSLEVLQSDFRELLDNNKVHSVLLNIDSPGGTSDLVQEMGDEIFAARSIKPIHAIANTDAGSAAYWLMSQAQHLYSTPSGSVGSIGAYTVHEDQSTYDANEGIKYTFISAGPYKTEGNPHEPSPTTEENSDKNE